MGLNVYVFLIEVLDVTIEALDVTGRGKVRKEQLRRQDVN